jgi:pimeloyl-ACP methyl ester carboxylesterase
VVGTGIRPLHPIESDAIATRDGRRLTFSATGAAHGHPVLYLHGAIGSPLRRSPALEEAIARLGLRYVMVNRPGFGGSDPCPGRRVADFARDVEDLADALGYARISIVGVSAGGPYALACAWALPDRVAAAAVVSTVPPCFSPRRASGMDPRYRLGLMALAAAPRLASRLGDAVLGAPAVNPGLVGRAIRLGSSGSDHAAIGDPDARRAAARTFYAAAEGGVGQMVEDFLVCLRPWGFDPEQVGGRVHLWHGLADRLVPARQAIRLAHAIPNCTGSLARGDGHFFFRDRLTEILGPLVEAQARGDGSSAGRRSDPPGRRPRLGLAA